MAHYMVVELQYATAIAWVLVGYQNIPLHVVTALLVVFGQEYQAGHHASHLHTSPCLLVAY